MPREDRSWNFGRLNFGEFQLLFSGKDVSTASGSETCEICGIVWNSKKRKYYRYWPLQEMEGLRIFDFQLFVTSTDACLAEFGRYLLE